MPKSVRKTTPQKQVSRSIKGNKNKPSNLPPQSPKALIQRAQNDPTQLSSDDVLQLQRTIGNRATTNLIQRKKGFWGKTFDRLFGAPKPRTQLEVAPTKTFTNTKSENQHIMANYNKRLRVEQKAVKSFTYQHYRDAETMPDSDQRLTAIQFIQNPITWGFFRQHCDTEFSGENPRFLDFVLDSGRLSQSLQDRRQELDEQTSEQEWQAPQGWDRRSEERLKIRTLTVRQALAIFHTFIEAGSAKYEINISSRTRNNIAAHIQQIKDNIGRSHIIERPVNGNDPAPRPLLYLINTAVGEIISLCNDSITRFQKNPAYKLALLAMQNNANLDIYAREHRRDMNFYLTAEDRKKNTSTPKEFWLGVGPSRKRR